MELAPHYKLLPLLNTVYNIYTVFIGYTYYSVMCWYHHKMNNLFSEEQVPYRTYKSATKYDLDIPPIPRRTQLDLHYNYRNDFHFQILILVFFLPVF